MLRRRTPEPAQTPARDPGQDARAWPLPGPNRLVALRLGDDEPRRTRVDDRAGASIVTPAPSAAGGRPVRVGIGTRIELGWTTAEGSWTCSAEVVAVTAQPLPRWTLRPLAPPVRSQRRAAYRLVTQARVEVAVDGRVVHGRLLDLSDVGARCRLRGADLPADVPLRVTLPLPDGPLTVTAVVARACEGDGGEGCYGLRFVGDDRVAGQRIRRHVLDAQLRGRGSRRARA